MFRIDWVVTQRRSLNFDANCSNQALRVLKYPDCPHELCFTSTAAVPSADCLDKQANQQVNYDRQPPVVYCIWCFVLQYVRCPTHRWLAHTAAGFGYRSAGLDFSDLWTRSHWEALVLFSPLGLQSQLVGHLKRLAQGQYNLIGQVLYRKGQKGRAGNP